MYHILEDINSPTQQRSYQPRADWTCDEVEFETDGTASLGEPDTYRIKAQYEWAIIDGRYHVQIINAQAIGLNHQPRTVMEDVRNHLEFVVFNEPIVFE